MLFLNFLADIEGVEVESLKMILLHGGNLISMLGSLMQKNKTDS